MTDEPRIRSGEDHDFDYLDEKDEPTYTDGDVTIRGETVNLNEVNEHVKLDDTAQTPVAGGR